MQPNNQLPNYDNYSIDYLNQISKPVKPKQPLSHWLFIILAGAALLGVIVLLFWAIGSGSKTTDERLVDLSVRLEVLEKVSKSQHSRIKSSLLRSYNGSFDLQLANAINDLNAVLEDQKIDTKKLSKKVDSEKKALRAALDKKFEEADLDVAFDRTYAMEMTYQIDVLKSMITAIKDKVPGSLMKKFVDNNQSSLTDLGNKFNGFQTYSYLPSEVLTRS